MPISRRTALFALCIASLSAPAISAPYPEKTVKIVVPFPAGGPTDAAARILAQHLTKELGGSFVIENVTGAGGTIGSAAVAKAAPNGYTLLFTSAAHVSAGAYYSGLSYDPVKSFDGISLVAEQPVVIAVNANSRYQTLADLVNAAKAAPGKMNYAAGAGGAAITGLVGRLFLESAGIRAQEITFRGSAPALQALIAGDVEFDADLPAGMAGLIAGQRLRPLAVSSKERYKLMPDVPSIAETIDPQFNASSWQALLAPAGTPGDITRTLNAAVNKLLAQSEVQS